MQQKGFRESEIPFLGGNMKVIFFDIDGTITNFDGKIADSTVKGIQMTREKGNIAALCSGRSENQIYDYILDIGFDAIVSAAGARVSVGGEVIYQNTVDEKQYKHCLDELLGGLPNICVQTDEYVYVWEKGYDRLNSVFPRMEKDDRSPAERIGNIKLVPSLYPIKNVQKMFYHAAPWTVEEVQEKIGDYFLNTEMSFGKPDPYTGEITVRGIEKSTGMEQLLKYYGLKREDSVAFGDGPNDRDMMRYAGVSVAMGNAWEEIKELADFVTSSVDEDGIYMGLKHFGLI